MRAVLAGGDHLAIVGEDYPRAMLGIVSADVAAGRPVFLLDATDDRTMLDDVAEVVRGHGRDRDLRIMDFDEQAAERMKETFPIDPVVLEGSAERILTVLSAIPLDERWAETFRRWLAAVVPLLAGGAEGIGIRELKQHTPFDATAALAEHSAPGEHRERLLDYLRALPGYDPGRAPMYQSKEVLMAHARMDVGVGLDFVFEMIQMLGVAGFPVLDASAVFDGHDIWVCRVAGDFWPGRTRMMDMVAGLLAAALVERGRSSEGAVRPRLFMTGRAAARVPELLGDRVGASVVAGYEHVPSRAAPSFQPFSMVRNRLYLGNRPMLFTPDGVHEVQVE